MLIFYRQDLTSLPNLDTNTFFNTHKSTKCHDYEANTLSTEEYEPQIFDESLIRADERNHIEFVIINYFISL